MTMVCGCNKIIFYFFSGLGGSFLLKEGKARQHVMPDFSVTPIHTEEDLVNWLNFFNMSAPLIAVGTLVSADPVSNLGSCDLLTLKISVCTFITFSYVCLGS